jgi:hypothetical protein
MTAWSTLALAVLTLLLTLGIAFAAAQFFLTRKFNRTLETDHLFKELRKVGLWEGRSKLDTLDDLEGNRLRANRLYKVIHRLRRFKSFRELDAVTSDFIEDVARLTERIEIYIRKGVADEGIIAEHAGYDVLMTYCCLRDILQKRAAEDDLNYEGFRDLALRIQDYAKLHPRDADLRDDLVWDSLPRIEYKGGDESLGYYIPWWSLLRKARLWVAWRRHNADGGGSEAHHRLTVPSTAFEASDSD